MNDPLGTISQNKLICTGVLLDFTVSPDMTPTVDSEADFTQLVSDYYVLFREEITQDVSFLRGVQGHRSIAEFDNAIYLLRTAKQHSDNARAATFYREWQTRHGTWQEQASAIARLLLQALVELAHCSARVRRDRALTDGWRSNAAADPSSIFEAVCRDLAISFSRGNSARLIRSVEARVKHHLSPGDNAHDKIQAWCAEEVTGQLRDLPVPYHAVLDRLGLLGDRRAGAALHLAYSIAASTSLRGGPFLDRIEESWKVAAR